MTAPTLEPLDYHSWKNVALDYVQQLADTGRTFTFADVEKAGCPPPPRPQHWGPLSQAARALRIVRWYGTCLGPRPSAHSTLTRTLVGYNAKDYR